LQNTSGDSKIKVFKRIGKVLFPDLYVIDEDSIGSRVKGKTERYTKLASNCKCLQCDILLTLTSCFSLHSRYKKELKRLQQTGGGLGGSDDSVDVQDYNKYLDCYIPNTGPDVTTTEEAKNIWGIRPLWFAH
jgi:hypothetical protein